MDGKKPELDELVLVAEATKNENNRQQLKDKGRSNAIFKHYFVRIYSN